MQTKIKICGLTNLDDARIACKLGADFLGFIFVPESKRHVTSDQVAEITRALPDTARRVGVFRDEPVEFVLDTMKKCRLDIAQLHGAENAEFAKRIGLDRCWKVFTLESDDDCARAIDFPSATVLVDSLVAGQSGGTGVTCDWSLAARVAASRPTVLAGGLTPDNVLEAIQAVKPFAVDVSSGVECEPGRKDPVKLKRFIDNSGISVR
jgi:phosphoribosylanthranilate isomerase